jgi:hypothetical protein
MRPIKVHVSDSGFVDDLVDALRAQDCDAARGRDRIVEVRRGWPREGPGAEYELDGFLRAWEALRPGVAATRVG